MSESLLNHLCSVKMSWDNYTFVSKEVETISEIKVSILTLYDQYWVKRFQSSVSPSAFSRPLESVLPENFLVTQILGLHPKLLN